MFPGTEGDKFFTVVTVREVIMLFLGDQEFAGERHLFTDFTSGKFADIYAE